MKLIYYIALFTFLFGSIHLKSQENLTLSTALQIGLEKNYGIRVTNLNVEIAQNNNSWGNAGIFPKIDLSIDPGFNGYSKENTTDTKTFLGTDTSYSSTSELSNFGMAPGISMNWVLFRGFAIQITKDKLEQYQKLSEGNLAVIVENTIQAIYLGYYSCLLEKEKLKILNDVMALSKDRFDYMEQKKALGSAVSYEVLQAKNAYLSDSSNYLLQEMNVKNSLRNLSMLLGESVLKDYNLIDEFMIIANEYEFGELFNQMQNNNKTLKNQYINQEILKKDIGLAKSSLYPTVSFFASGNYPISNANIDNTITSKTNGTFSYLANFSISMNLFNGFNRMSDIQNAKIREEIGSIQIDEMKIKLSILLANMLDLYNIRKQLLNVADESLETARLNMQISNEKFKSGAINSFNYRDVQLIYINSSFNKLQATYNLIESHSELMRITGNVITEY